jgi:hypothetical protein
MFSVRSLEHHEAGRVVNRETTPVFGRLELMRIDDPRLRTYQDVVADHRRRYAGPGHAEMRMFGNPRQTLLEAIHRACRSQIPKKRGRGLKRHSHQPVRAVSDEALGEAAARLQAIEVEIAAATDFAALLGLIEEAIANIQGIGELAVYDIAHRIGAYRGLHPEEVYLHAGTRKGAKALGLPVNRKSLPMTSLPAGLRSLSAEEAEDLLCIYRKTLARIHGAVETITQPS